MDPLVIPKVEKDTETHDEDVILVESKQNSKLVMPRPIVFSSLDPPPKVLPERKVKIENIGEFQTLVITQKVEVKPKFKCIIHLNANICDKKHKHKRKYQKRSKQTEQKKQKPVIPKKEKEEPKLTVKERIVPVCYRSHYCCRKARKVQPMCTPQLEIKHGTHENETKIRSIPNNKPKKPVTESRRRKGNKLSKKSRYESELSFTLSDLSPISSDTDYGNLSYDDVSSGNLNSEDEMDILIQKTKERERLLIQQELSQWPHTEQNNSRESRSKSEDRGSVYSSEMDISIHSLATVILTRVDTEVYSPTQDPENFYFQEAMVPSNSYTEVYSPTMDPAEICYLCNEYQGTTERKTAGNSYNNNLYSPTMDPVEFCNICHEGTETKNTDMVQVKRELLTPPLNSDSIYNNNTEYRSRNNNLKSIKTERVKVENREPISTTVSYLNDSVMMKKEVGY